MRSVRAVGFVGVKVDLDDPVLIDEPVPTAVTDEMRLERVNMGIAIVTPVDELVQLLEHRRFADARAQRDAGQHSTAWRQVEWLRDGQSR